MNEHYDSCMAGIHKPATKARIGDLCIFMGHIALNVQPTLSTMIYPDYVKIAKEFGRGIMFRGLLKKK